ncbi:MAG: 8-oxo-dGTP pyrophosphatase MutT (NUDIX family) [Planctomycetota bacterium]|jgi:8-oxo-dGTP pyrophosphatase MutT (NUDIX family)
MEYISNEEQVIFSGDIVAVLQKDVQIGEKVKRFERAVRAPGVRLIIDTGSGVIMNNEFRHELGERDIRLPGGKVFDSLQEYLQAVENGMDMQAAAMSAARIEAKEEVGLESISLEFIDRLVCGATMKWDLFYFAVHDYVVDADHETGSVDHEIQGSREFTYQQSWDMCMAGEIQEGRSAIVLLRWLHDKMNK